MSDEPLVRQPTMAPIRKVSVGGMNGAGAVVGLNLLAEVIMNRTYGGIENVPDDMLRLVLWTVSAVPVAWQYAMAWYAKSRKDDVQ
jgi:hypothetical protein